MAFSSHLIPRRNAAFFFRSWFRDGMLPFFRKIVLSELFGRFFICWCLFLYVDALLFDAFWGPGPPACAMAGRLCEFTFLHVF